MIARPMIARRHVLLGGLTALIGAQASAQDRTQDRIRVVASFSILGDLLRNVGGDRLEVATLVGPDSDAHAFSPTPADARTLGSAKAVVVNGLGLEGWMTRLVKASGGKAPVVVASQGIATRTLEGAVDPHAWQSVANAKVYIANIRDGLGKADPTGRGTYEANAAVYLGKLDALEREVRAAIGRIPAERRKIITTHDAFGYFGSAYGLTLIAPEGVSTDTEPSARDVARIITQIKTQKIPALFMENIVDPRLMRQIARETGAKVGGTLYSDALSGPAEPAATYIDMMRHNVGELSKALAP
jgi:zinc/manganese transport system substrate-binding protein